MYAGFATPAPALNAPKNTITLQDGSSPTPTYPGGTTTTSPSKPKGSAN
jgi:hypothetical protein